MGELREIEIPLYEGIAPGSESWVQVETDGVMDSGLHVVRNVVRPTLTPFLPERRVGVSPTSGAPAVIIAPGGAWHFLAWDHEGIQVAEWLRDRGIAAFILKYRLLPTDDTFPRDYEAHGRRGPNFMQSLAPYLLISADAQRPSGLVRSRAEEWGIVPGKVGIMGFSAGGTVTSLATLQYDASSRPDFAAPIYGAGAPGDVPADARRSLSPSPTMTSRAPQPGDVPTLARRKQRGGAASTRGVQVRHEQDWPACRGLDRTVLRVAGVCLEHRMMLE